MVRGSGCGEPEGHFRDGCEACVSLRPVPSPAISILESMDMYYMSSHCLSFRWATEEPEPDEDGELPKKSKAKGKAKKKKETQKHQSTEEPLPPPVHKPKRAQGAAKAKVAGDDGPEACKEPVDKKKKKKPANVPTDCRYVPGEFSQARLRFIRKRQAKGWTFRDASNFWNSSKTRANMLARLPPSERARRRF